MPALNAARTAFNCGSTGLRRCSLAADGMSYRSMEPGSPSSLTDAKTTALTLHLCSIVDCVAVWPHRPQPHKARPILRRSVGRRPAADSWARHGAGWKPRLLALRRRWALLPMKKHLAPYRSRTDQALLAWRGHVSWRPFVPPMLKYNNPAASTTESACKILALDASTAIKTSAHQELLKCVFSTPVAILANSSPRLFACSPNAFSCICINSV